MSAAPQIHPTAIISAEALLAADVSVGPYAVIDGAVKLGAGSIVRAHAHLIGPFNAGEGNDFGTGCAVGGRPQHLAYKNEPTDLTIGNFNTFREHVTIHRGMPNAGRGTVIGDHNYFMCTSHVAHDCIVGNHTLFINGCMIGGHCEIGDRVLISGNAAVHQFERVGRLALLRGQAVVTQDVPPFWIVQARNEATGVNVIGMRRAGMPSPEIQAVRKAYTIMYRGNLLLSAAVAKVEAELGQHAAIQELIAFIRASKRGIPGGHRSSQSSDAQAA